MDYRLRACTPDDDGVQLDIYASTRAAELALTDWSAEQRASFVLMQHRAQQQHYRTHYPASQCHLILTQERVAGRLWLDRRGAALHVLDIAVLPAFRGQGLGERCLRDLFDGCDELSIYVEIHNPARRLYERLGFFADGEPQGVHQRMLRRAPHLQECLP